MAVKTKENRIRTLKITAMLFIFVLAVFILAICASRERY